MKDIPVYKVVIDKKNGKSLSKISLVNDPAIIVKGVAFENHIEKEMFFSDDNQMRIAAPALIPMNIYRKDAELGEFYIQFTSDTIDELHKEFMMNLNNKDLFNVEHNSNTTAPAYILDIWTVGKEPKLDKSYSEFGIEVPSGSLFVVSQFTNRDYYNKLVESGQTGFSIEGVLGLELTDKIRENNMSNLFNGKIVIDGVERDIVNGVLVEMKCEPGATASDTAMATDTATTDTNPVDTPTDQPSNTPLDMKTVMETVQPLIDELASAIADVKAQCDSLASTETADTSTQTAQTEMSSQQKLSLALKFMNTAKN